MTLRTIITCLLISLHTLANADILFDLDHVEVVRVRQKNRLLDWSNREANLLGLADVSATQIYYRDGEEETIKRHYWSWKNDKYESTDSKLVEYNDGLAIAFVADSSRFKLTLRNNTTNEMLIKLDTLSIVFKTPFTPDEIVTLKNDELGKVISIGPSQSNEFFFHTTKGEFVFDENIYGGTDFSFSIAAFAFQADPNIDIRKRTEELGLPTNNLNDFYKMLERTNNPQYCGFESTCYMSVIANTRNTKH